MTAGATGPSVYGPPSAPPKLGLRPGVGAEEVLGHLAPLRRGRILQRGQQIGDVGMSGEIGPDRSQGIRPVALRLRPQAVQRRSDVGVLREYAFRAAARWAFGRAWIFLILAATSGCAAR